MNVTALITVVGILLSMTGMVQADQKIVDQLLNGFKKQGAQEANVQLGKELWSKGFKQNKDGSLRRCSSCHSDDLSNAGKHIRTGKTIKPMSLSVNPKRLTSQKKVKKWLLRNCKWTLGRECSAQEKANIIAYINTSKKLAF